LGELPKERTWPAADFLRRVAGDKGPALDLSTDVAVNRKCRDAWAAWWKDNGNALEIPAQDDAPRLNGYTLVVLLASGKVIELDREGKTRWTIDGLAGPVDAYVLGENRVLITECNGNRVTERDFKGKVLWQKDGLGAPTVNAQRLSNGNTFIALTNRVMEVDREGKTIINIPAPNGVVAGIRARNGQIVYVSNNGMCVRMDADGKELKSFQTNRNGGYTSGIDMLPNGNVLIAKPNNTVTEFDADGKTIWEATLPGGVTSATRLTNGHTLVASVNGSVIELDRAGKTVWEYKDGQQPIRARRR
jgi:hypothetical protein